MGRGLVALALGATLLLGGCGGGSDAPAALDGGDQALFDAVAEVELEVALSEFHFDPETVELPVSELVAITLRNDGSTEHDFTIKRIDGAQAYRLDDEPPSIDRADGEDVHVALLPGTSAELRLRVTEPGEYELYCAVSGHRRAGMRTTLTVR